MQVTFFLFGDIPIPGSVKGEAFIKDMLPIQREINIMRSMFATCQKMGNSMWLVPMGSAVDEDEITNEEAVSCTIHRLKGRDQNESAHQISRLSTIAF